MVREQIAAGVYKYGKQIGTRDLPDMLLGFSKNNAPHYKRSRWQRRMNKMCTNFDYKDFQTDIPLTVMRTRKLSHKQQQRMERDMAAIFAR